jgi:hypothetical protein
VNCSDGIYNQEEGNYGKLLRIWQEGFQYRPKPSALIEQTISDYLVFRKEAITSGLDTLARIYLPPLSDDSNIIPIIYNGSRVGWKTERAAFLLGSYLSTKHERQAILALAAVPSIFILTDKYAWKEYHHDGGKLTVVSSGKKPKQLRPGVV